VFVAAPDVPYGWWEFYAVTDDNPVRPEGRSTSVCAGKQHLRPTFECATGRAVSDPAATMRRTP
jgi:hypothetical protein